MSNEKTKKKVQVWMDPDLVVQIDGVAAREGMTRAAVLTAAAEAYLGGGSAEDATAAKLDAISAKLEAMEASNRLAAAGVLEAVRNQPIAVQQPAELPAPEVTDADIRKYIGKHCPDVELVGLFGDEIKLRKKGFFSRFSSKP